MTAIYKAGEEEEACVLSPRLFISHSRHLGDSDATPVFTD